MCDIAPCESQSEYIWQITLPKPDRFGTRVLTLECCGVCYRRTMQWSVDELIDRFVAKAFDGSYDNEA